MKSRVKKIKDCKHRMSAEVGDPRLEECFQSVLKKIQSQATLKGYRQGKAPLKLIETTYPEEARQEVLKSLVSETYFSVLRDSKILAITQPHISDVKLERGKQLSFEAEFECFPQFTPKKAKGIKVSKKLHVISDDEVQKAISQLAEARATTAPIAIARPVVNGDILKCDIELIENDQYRPAQQDAMILVETQGPQGKFAEQLIGVQIDQTRIIKDEPSPDQRAKGVIGQVPRYRVKVKSIEKRELPELNDEFAKTMGRENLSDLKIGVRKELERIQNMKERDQLLQQIHDELLKSHNFALPQSIVEQERQRILADLKSHNHGSEDTHEKEATERSERQVRLFFILEKIAEQEGLEPTEAEIEQRIQEEMKNTGQSYEETQKRHHDQIHYQLKRAKTMDFLLKHATVKEIS